MNKIIANKILSQVKKDQKLRKQLFKPNYKPTEIEYKILRKTDDESSKLIKDIIENIGLPAISKVGSKASTLAWLLVQHSDDLKLQKYYLQLLKDSPKSDIHIENIAYLEDRIRMKDNKPQLYGTQVVFNSDKKEWTPYKIKSKNNINTLRKKMNLEPLEEYLKTFN